MKPFKHQTVFVAATGASLTSAVAELLRGQHVIAVNDAFKLLPFADLLYACDAKWWEVHNGCMDFAGERWSTHEIGGSNDKRAIAKKYGVSLIAGRSGDKFRTDGTIAYGSNSGFQAIGLAIWLGAARIVLVGFDMRDIAGKRHFFGDHPKPLRNGGCFCAWLRVFAKAAKRVPPGVEIVNATSGSALMVFPLVSLEAECASLR